MRNILIRIRENNINLQLYYVMYFGIVGIIFTFAKDYLLKNMFITSISFVFLFFLAPFIILSIAEMKPAFSKWLRVSLFFTFRVSTFAKASFVILLTLNILFICNYIFSAFSAKLIFIDLLIVNLILLFFISLLLSGRFHIKDRLGLLIQQYGHHEIYLYKEMVLRHIPDPPTFQLLGYSSSDVNVISHEEFVKYTVRPALESIITGRLVRANNKHEVYIILDGEKRHVPDPPTLVIIQQLKSADNQKREVDIISEHEVNTWPTGKPLASIIK